MSTRAWVTFGAVSVLWGIPYLFIKVAVDDGVPPAFLAWVRVILAAALLLALAQHAGTLSSVRGHWRWRRSVRVVVGCSRNGCCEIQCCFFGVSSWRS